MGWISLIDWIFIVCILYLPVVIVFIVWEEEIKRKIKYGGVYTIIACVVVLIVMNTSFKYTSFNIKSSAINKNEYVHKQNTQSKNCISTSDNTIVINQKEKIGITNEINKSIENANLDYKYKKSQELRKEIEIVLDFKKELFDIEKQALLPLRKSYEVLKNVQKGRADIADLLKEIKSSKDKCQLVENKYMNLEVPEGISDDNKKLMNEAKNDLQKAYFLRGDALDDGIIFLEKKNVKYIFKCKEKLNLADKYIYSCVEKLNQIKCEVNK